MGQNGGGGGGGILRDIYLLASLVCVATSAATLFVLLVKYPGPVPDEKALALIPESCQNDIGVFRYIIIGVAAFVCGLSLISFVGSLFRSGGLIKLGLHLTVLVIIIQVALVGWFYFKDPTFEKTSATVWNMMPEERKQQFMTEARCDSEQSCRDNIKNLLVDSHPRFLMYCIVGVVTFQLISLLFGCCMLSSIRRGNKNYIYRYPTGTIV